MSRLVVAAVLALLAACGVKAPPRPPVGATKAVGAPAKVSEPGSGADAAPANDCGPAAATAQGSQR